MEIRARINEYLSAVPEVLKEDDNSKSQKEKENTNAEAIIAFTEQSEKLA